MQREARGFDAEMWFGRCRYKVAANKDDLSPDHLDEANVMVFGGPREK